uniref:Uncharacterized protein n=1 Tax=Cucumis melo TaxID=3656 RepID=A0A9I9DAW4_CUCME
MSTQFMHKGFSSDLWNALITVFPLFRCDPKGVNEMRAARSGPSTLRIKTYIQSYDGWIDPWLLSISKERYTAQASTLNLAQKEDEYVLINKMGQTSLIH